MGQLTITNQVWDLAVGLPVIIQDGATKYITGPGGLPVEQVAGDGRVLYYLQDQLGSTRGLTDSTGTLVGTFSYDAYGNLTSSSGTATTPFGYAGQYTDSESGLQYLRARYYDPQTAQFLTVDPLVGLTQQPYGYTLGDPLNFNDPAGLLGWGDVGSFVHRHTGAIVVAGVVVVVVAGTACVLATVGICAGVELPTAAALMGSASVAGTEAATVAEEDAGPATDAAATMAETCPGAIDTGASAFEQTITTPGGPVTLYGDVAVEGDAVTIDQLTIYGAESPYVRAGSAPFRQALRLYARELAAKGYKTLRITGWRTKNGREPDITIDLTRFLR